MHQVLWFQGTSCLCIHHSSSRPLRTKSSNQFRGQEVACCFQTRVLHSLMHLVFSIPAKPSLCFTKGELDAKFGGGEAKALYAAFKRVFSMLPLAALVHGKTLILHGGVCVCRYMFACVRACGVCIDVWCVPSLSLSLFCSSFIV